MAQDWVSSQKLHYINILVSYRVIFGSFIDLVPRPPLRKGKIYHVLGKRKYLHDDLLYIITLFSCPQITGCVSPGFEIAAFLSNYIQNDFVGLTWNDEWDPIRVVINFFPYLVMSVLTSAPYNLFSSEQWQRGPGIHQRASRHCRIWCLISDWIANCFNH